MDDLLRALISALRPQFALPDDPWDAVDLIWRLCDHRFPVNLRETTLFEWRVSVIPCIYKPKARNPLTEALLCSPGTVFLVRDPVFDGLHGIFMAMAGPDDHIAEWVRRSAPLRMVLGEQRSVRLIAAPLSSFTGNAKDCQSVD